MTGAGTGLRHARRELRRQATARRAAANRWFFKTGPGEYGEGDQFLGVSLPGIRAVARAHRDLPLAGAVALLRSPWHEERLLALILLVERYRRGDERQRAAVHRAYLRHIRWVNSWDLVDVSAAPIVGAHLPPRRRALLRRLARSSSVWERRIAMIATFQYIRAGEFTDALAIARLLLKDRHDLIHKAVGWMLREIGKKDERVLDTFLTAHAARMPRTALRYAIERLPPAKRRRLLRLTREQGAGSREQGLGIRD